MLNVQLSVSYN